MCVQRSGDFVQQVNTQILVECRKLLLVQILSVLFFITQNLFVMKDYM